MQTYMKVKAIEIDGAVLREHDNQLEWSHDLHDTQDIIWMSYEHLLQVVCSLSGAFSLSHLKNLIRLPSVFAASLEHV